MRDLYHNVQEAHIVPPAAPVADFDSTAVDMRGYESLIILVMVGALMNAGFAIVLEDCDDLATWVPVAAGLIQGPDAALAVNTSSKYGYLGIKRYVRVALTVTGATNVGVIAIKERAARAPTEA